MSQRDIFELRKEVEFKRKQIVKLQQDLKDRDSQLIQLEHQVRKYQEVNQLAEDQLVNIEKLVQERAEKAATFEQEKYRQLVHELQEKNIELERQIKKFSEDRRRLDDKNAEIEFLNSKIREISQSGAGQGQLHDLRRQKDDNLEQRRELERVTRNWTELSKQMDDILCENRVLREMAGVPENYGFDLNEIKLVEKQKIEEYKGRVQRLEEEVEELEKERVDLRYRLRNMSTLYGEKGLRFYNLTAEQMKLVDDFAKNLRDGRVDLPLNDRSRELLREIEKLKAQIQILETYNFGQSGNTNANEELLEQIRQENKEVKDLLLKLFSGTANQQDKEAIAVHVLQLPPVPIPGQDGTYQEGYSYRFGSKMPVAEIYTGDATRDLAALQLQMIETLELLSRRDNDEKMTEMELEDFRQKLREILLVQENLYDQYDKETKQWRDEKLRIITQRDDAMDELKELRVQVAHYEEMSRTIQQNNPNTDRAKVAELTSRIALLDVSNLRLTRKYDCLQSEEKDLRQAYHAIEAENAEKDVVVQKRIGKLKEWRVSATLQLQFLFKQLRQSVSHDKFEAACHDLSVLREKQSNWLDREAQLYQRLGRFENMERENEEMQDKVKKMNDLKIEMESELEMISRRLEAIDQGFQIEQNILRRIVSHLNTKHINPEQAFQIFDRNRDGRITRGEFLSALDNLGISLSRSGHMNELDSLMRSISQDLDGNIRYQDFIRKLQIYGVEEMREEQIIIKAMYEAIVQLNYTLYDVFQIFDVDGDGCITKQEFINSFLKFGKGFTISQLEKVLKLIDVNRDGTIAYEEFKSIFEREYQKGSTQQSARSLDWKDELFNEIGDAIRKNNLDMNEAFSAFDSNRDGKITKSEFFNVFRRMGISLTSNQQEELWRTMNKDRDGSISYVEFVSQFRQSERQRETQQVINEAQQAVTQAQSQGFDRRSIAVLEAREQAALNKAERFQTRMQSLEISLAEMEKQLSQYESKNLDLTSKYHYLREEEGRLRLALQATISKAEAEKMRQNNEILSKELAEARAAMNTYKNIVTVSSDHVRALQFTIDRRKDEITTFQNAIRELQADSQDAATVGKLFHQVMVSRWAEASANRKYDSVINETRELRNEVFKLEGDLMDKEQSLYGVQQVLTEKVSDYERMITDLKARSENSITLERAEQLVAQIRDLGDKKSELEDLNRRLRRELNQLKDTKEIVELMRNEAKELLELVKTGSSDELSDKLIEISERLSDLRLKEMKARRKAGLAKESKEYYNKLHLKDQDAIQQLEREIARQESAIARKEEMWRKKDDERQKMLLNPKFQKPQIKFTKKEPDLSDDQISGLKDQIRLLENTVRARDEQIEHLTKIRTEAEMMGSSLTKFTPANFMNQQEIQRAYDEQEIDHLANAAGATVNALQEMIKHKNDQLDRKEDIIKRLQNDIMSLNQDYAKQMAELQSQLEQRIHGPVAQLQNAQQVQYTQRNIQYQPEMDALLQNKDQTIQQLMAQLNAAKEAKENAEQRLAKLRHELDDVQYQLDLAKADNSSAAMKKEVSNLRKKLNIKNKELDNLRQSIKSIKADLLEQAERNMQKDKEIETMIIREGSDNTLVTQRIKKAEQRITQQTKQLKEAREELEKLKQDKIMQNEKETKLREENRKLLDNSQRKQEILDKLSRENKELKGKEQAARTAPRPTTNETKQLREQITQLQQDKERLQQRLKQLKEVPNELDPRTESILRRLGTVLRNRGISLVSISERDKVTESMLIRALQERSVGLNEQELNSIIQSGLQLAQCRIKVRDQEQSGIDLKMFEQIIRQILTRPPKPIFNQTQSRPQSAVEKTEEKRKVDSRAEVLSLQLAETIKELEQNKKELDYWKEIASRLELEKANLQNSLLQPITHHYHKSHYADDAIEELKAEFLRGTKD